MDTKFKRAAFVMATAFMVPGAAYAQDAEQAIDAAVTASEQTVDAAAGSSETVETAVTDATASASTTADAATAEPKAAPEAKEAAVEPVNMAQHVEDQKSSKAARKEAMRNLSATYPENGQKPVAVAEDEPAQAKAVSEPAYIPPTFKTTERMPRFEHHGYFRTRLNYFGNYDLNTRGTSPVGVPLNSDHRGTDSQEYIDEEDSDAHLGANMRFRYQPTIHITESIRIAGTFDVMDNFVLGTTPNGLKKNWGADQFFSFNGAEAVDSDTILSNVLKVKALYGEADTIIGTFKAGRVPTHWGLGLVYNDGGVYKRDQQMIEGHGWKNLDADASDAIDKIEWRIRDPFVDILYLSFSWDFANSGLASYSPDSYSQAFDLSEGDDVLQFTISVFDRPISQQEVDTRYRKLFETREWTVDWGAFYSYRSQDQAPEQTATQQDNGAYANYVMYEKSAEAHVFDVWGRFFFPLDHDLMLRLEAEFVGAVGSVKLDTGNEGDERDIVQLGMGIEFEIWWKDLITGVKTGFAWADHMLYSGDEMIEDFIPMGSLLRFDSSYRVDEIMFHELMGGINNAWYLNLYGEYKFPLELSQITMSLGARLDLTTSVPLVKKATPGKGSWYGFEADAKLFYEESDRFRFEIGGGIFVPGDAWEYVGSGYPELPKSGIYNREDDSYSPEIAWNVLANLYFMF